MWRPAPTAGGRYVDLHAHTHFSDGTLSPEELVAVAIQKRLSALAVTDHDSLEALPRARAAAGTALELVPGIELSSTSDGADLHILGYYLDPEFEPLHERLARFRSDRRQRALDIVKRLGELGAPVDPEAVLRLAGPGVVGRPHIAEALIQARHAHDLEDAFRRYLSARGAAFIPRPAFAPREAIALIHSAQGVSVLAHPGSMISQAVVESLAAVGLKGIEVWHPQHTPATMKRLHGLANRLGLLETGGSDYHGPRRGTELGDLDVPITVLGPLKQAAGVTG
ncbi:MAG TPA: PHP domain-containing protein [Candidatus Eisenbacteria bacterium]